MIDLNFEFRNGLEQAERARKQAENDLMEANERSTMLHTQVCFQMISSHGLLLATFSQTETLSNIFCVSKFILEYCFYQSKEKN